MVCGLVPGGRAAFPVAATLHRHQARHYAKGLHVTSNFRNKLPVPVPAPAAVAAPMRGHVQLEVLPHDDHGDDQVASLSGGTAVAARV